MKLSPDSLRRMSAPLYGFSGEPVGAEGEVTLPVTIGAAPRQKTLSLNFLVVRIPSAYNVIFGRPSLNAFQAVVSTYHLLIRFPTRNGIGEVRGDQQLARHCLSIQSKKPLSGVPGELDRRELESRGEPAEQVISIPLREEDPARTVQIGTLLSEDLKEQLIKFLRRNADIFAWSASEMPGIPTEVITHALHIDPAYKPVRQKKRNFAPERQKAIEEEVDKLLDAHFIREVSYPKWLANVVMVKKASGKWRICIDYTDLNKACPKDSFPLPKIDQLVDATSGRAHPSISSSPC